MQKFFFDIKDASRFEIELTEFENSAAAIAHCGVLAEHFYRDSLTDDQDLEISVVNALGREIHREIVHRRWPLVGIPFRERRDFDQSRPGPDLHPRSGGQALIEVGN